MLPPDAEADVLDDPAEATAYARQHPDRQDVRIVAGATRAGATYCALRMRAADDDQQVLAGPSSCRACSRCCARPWWTTRMTPRTPEERTFGERPF